MDTLKKKTLVDTCRLCKLGKSLGYCWVTFLTFGLVEARSLFVHSQRIYLITHADHTQRWVLGIEDSLR